MKKNIISALLGALLSLGVFALAYFFLDQSHIDKFLPRNKVEAIIYFPIDILPQRFARNADFEQVKGKLNKIKQIS